MLLFEDYNFAYLHINKTGGSTVKNFLNEMFPGSKVNIGKGTRPDGIPIVHQALNVKKEVLGNGFNDLTILTTIRNPYARWFSLYTAAYRNHKEHRPRGKNPRSEATEHMPFNIWMRKIIFNPNFERPGHLSMTDFILVDGKIPKNLHIIKLEELEPDLRNFIKDNFDIDTATPLPHANRSSYVIEGHFMDHYDDALKQTVYDKDKFIFDKFYNKEVPDVVRRIKLI